MKKLILSIICIIAVPLHAMTIRIAISSFLNQDIHFLCKLGKYFNFKSTGTMKKDFILPKYKTQELILISKEKVIESTEHDLQCTTDQGDWLTYDVILPFDEKGETGGRLHYDQAYKGAFFL